MRPPRKTSRINLRFRDSFEMDAVELAANQDGLDLQNWLRWLVRDEMKDRSFRQSLQEQSLRSLLTCQYMLERVVDEAVLNDAQKQANEKLKSIEEYAGAER